jgi:hypothetical protein
MHPPDRVPHPGVTVQPPQERREPVGGIGSARWSHPATTGNQEQHQGA